MMNSGCQLTENILTPFPPDEKEPGRFNLQEIPQIPRLLEAVSEKCEIGVPTCGKCRRCQAEIYFNHYLSLYQQMSAHWQTELLLCCAEALPDSEQVMLLTMLSPMVIPPAGTDELQKLILTDENAEKNRDGLILPENTPVAEINRLFLQIVNCITWLKNTSQGIQRFFMLRALLLLDFSQVLRFCLDLQASHENNRNFIVQLPVLKQPVVQASPPVKPKQLYLDLEGIGVMAVREALPLPQIMNVQRMCYTKGSATLVGVSHSHVAVFCTRDPAVYFFDSIDGKRSKEIVPVSEDFVPLKIMLSDDATTFYIFTDSAQVLWYQNRSNKWSLIGKCMISADETIISISIHETRLTCCTSQSRLWIWEQNSGPGSPLCKISLEMPERTSGVAQAEFVFVYNDEFCCIALKDGGVALCSIPNGSLIKTCTMPGLPKMTIQELFSNQYLFSGWVGKHVYVWEVKSHSEAPKHTLLHTNLIAGMVFLEEQVIVGCRNGIIYQWSSWTGQLLSQVSCFPTDAPPVRFFSRISGLKFVLATVTRVYLVQLGEKSAELETESSTVVMEGTCRDSEPTAWRRRLVKLLNPTEPPKTLENENSPKPATPTPQIRTSTTTALWRKPAEKWQTTEKLLIQLRGLEHHQKFGQGGHRNHLIYEKEQETATSQIQPENSKAFKKSKAKNKTSVKVSS